MSIRREASRSLVDTTALSSGERTDTVGLVAPRYAAHRWA